MLLDHVGLSFFPRMEIFRIIGRLAFPIFAYMIAEGCTYTKNRKKYLGIILSMAIVFQLFYFVFMDDLYQGILVTFSLSIIIIFATDILIKGKGIIKRISMIPILAAVLFFGLACPEIFKSEGFAIDYNAWGIFLPVLIYYAPNKFWKIAFTGIIIVAMAIISRPLQWWALLTIPLFILYNGKRGKAKMKYFFYIFYPLHLVAIYGIMTLISILK